MFTVTLEVEVEAVSHADAVNLVQQAINTENAKMIEARKPQRLELMRSGTKEKGK